MGDLTITGKISIKLANTAKEFHHSFVQNSIKLPKSIAFKATKYRPTGTYYHSYYFLAGVISLRGTSGSLCLGGLHRLNLFFK